MDLMIDLETWGTSPGCAVRSIGAVTFDLGNDKHEEKSFYANISTRSCLYAGLRMERDTAEWWTRQSPEARAKLEENPEELPNVVQSFHGFVAKVGARYIWAQGANFDPGIWEAVARAVNGRISWKFHCVRDTRTVYDLARLDTREVKREGVYHGALDDARHQVRCLQLAYERLGLKGKELPRRT